MALAPLRPGDPPSYGPYRLQGRLGAGGMGVVFLAFGPDGASGSDGSHGSDGGGPVALKVLQPQLAEDSGYRVRFVREVRAAGLVDSPYVARVVAAETQHEPLWMATEYVEGATLAHAVEVNGPVPPDRLRGLASDLAEALAAMHAVGLVHRDLKPANVVLAWSGPKLIDFGIAKYDGATNLTQTGLTVGSLQWMSPEVLSGHPAGPPSDVFAWGLCVASAGTGRPPFGTGNPTAVAYRISTGEPDLAGLPQRLRELVAAALAKDPARRPTAPQLCSALAQQAQPPTVALPAQPSPAQPSPAQPSPVAAKQDRRRSRVLPIALIAALLIAAGVVVALLASSGTTHTPKAGPTAPPHRSAGGASSPSAVPTSAAPTSAVPTSAAPRLASLSDAEATVSAAGYTPDPDSDANWDPTAPINVILGTLTTSADGYNNRAFFFAGGRYIGHDTKDPSMTIAVRGRTPTVITLAYTIYAPTDPNCCPTGGTRAVRFEWNGTSVVALDPIPGVDPTADHR